MFSLKVSRTWTIKDLVALDWEGLESPTKLVPFCLLPSALCLSWSVEITTTKVMNNKLLKLLIVGVSLFPFTTPVEAQTGWFVKYQHSPHMYRVGSKTYCRVQNPAQLKAFRAQNRVQIVTSPQLLERKRNLGNCPWPNASRHQEQEF